VNTAALCQAVIGASIVWRRHFHVYRNTALYNFLPPMTEPIVYLIAFGYGLSPLVGEIEYYGVKVAYVRFLVAGMIAVGVLFQSYLEGAYSTYIRIVYQGTWAAQLTSPLTFLDVFLGDLAWAASKGTLSGVLTGVVGILWGAMTVGELLSVMPVIILGGFVFGAFGMLSGGYAKRIDFVNVPMFLCVVPMFALCGTYFPRTTLPPGFQAVVAVLPLSGLVDLLRIAIHPPPNLFLSMLSLLLWGGLFSRVAWKSIHRKIYK